MFLQPYLGLSRRAVQCIFWCPVLMTGGFALLLYIPATESLAFSLLEENNVVELSTFMVMIIGGCLGLLLAKRMKAAGESGWVVAFYAAFSVVLLFIAFEEIAWGQWLFGFDTPERVREVNEQGELTLHNIRGLNGRTELLRLAFGVGGMLGILASYSRRLMKVGAPQLLILWFVVVTVLAIPDIVNDYVAFTASLDRAINKLSELAELLIGGASLLYIWLNGRRWMIQHPDTESSVEKLTFP